MFTIGDFARLGGVSVRMLRHYDALGLLRPADVDPDSGYRFYAADQLRRLNRVIALKDLGFTLEQVGAILDEQVGIDELKGMLRLRRAELEAQLSADAARLARVEARLRSIEREGQMPTEEVTIKHVEPIRVAVMKDTAEGYAPEHISPVIRPLFGELGSRLHAAGLEPLSNPIAYHEDADGDRVTVHAAIEVEAEPGDAGGFEVVDLPRVERAATLVHHGPMEDVMPSYEALARWIEENGMRSVGRSREVTLECPAGPETWVTELQVTVSGG
jgi:DNA-binding transcriptional MerR regulator